MSGGRCATSCHPATDVAGGRSEPEMSGFTRESGTGGTFFRHDSQTAGWQVADFSRFTLTRARENTNSRKRKCATQPPGHAMTEFPSWLRDALITKGVLTPSGLSRKWKIRTCRGCQAWILAGLDSNVAALEVQADPVQLTVEGEAQALLDNRATYDDDGTSLSRRLHWHVTGRPAGQEHRVLPQHRCGSTIPATWTSSTKQPTTPVTTVQEVPF